jgi:hypothetical protein
MKAVFVFNYIEFRPTKRDRRAIDKLKDQEG